MTKPKPNPLGKQHPPGRSVSPMVGFPRRCRFDPCIWKFPWRRARQPTPVFLPENPRDRGAWRATVHGVARVGHDLVTNPPPWGVAALTGASGHQTCRLQGPWTTTGAWSEGERKCVPRKSPGGHPQLLSKCFSGSFTIALSTKARRWDGFLQSSKYTSAGPTAVLAVPFVNVKSTGAGPGAGVKEENVALWWQPLSWFSLLTFNLLTFPFWPLTPRTTQGKKSRALKGARHVHACLSAHYISKKWERNNLIPEGQIRKEEKPHWVQPLIWAMKGKHRLHNSGTKGRVWDTRTHKIQLGFLQSQGQRGGSDVPVGSWCL